MCQAGKKHRKMEYLRKSRMSGSRRIAVTSPRIAEISSDGSSIIKKEIDFEQLRVSHFRIRFQKKEVFLKCCRSRSRKEKNTEWVISKTF
ncbi:hypothetical protein CEXT_683161 [Caerostris extrusa]|uniref:Uncharacterized protein n=1 Tax=Caerostris extrusa TaxID=172846 RepID=A0AAV4V8I9_CAEEX|nr:hypothetical protein CEXT_683161 [Caerostris extrusa]